MITLTRITRIVPMSGQLSRRQTESDDEEWHRAQTRRGLVV